MNRRTFIAGTVAAGVGASLPLAEAATPEKLFVPSRNKYVIVVPKPAGLHIKVECYRIEYVSLWDGSSKWSCRCLYRVNRGETQAFVEYLNEPVISICDGAFRIIRDEATGELTYIATTITEGVPVTVDFVPNEHQPNS